MMTNLPSIYSDADHYDLIAQVTAPKDQAFYRQLLLRQGGPVLELACGTGRVCIELAGPGLEISGVDVSEAMLKQATQKAAAAQKSVTFELADVRDFDLSRQYSLILFPYNAVNHLIDLASLKKCFKTVRRHMTSESLWVIDTFNPDPEKLKPHSARQKILTYMDPKRGRPVVMYEETAYDAATQLNEIKWSYEVDGRLIGKDEWHMRIYFPQELDALLQLGGFEIVEKLGDYDGASFGARHAKQLLQVRVA